MYTVQEAVRGLWDKEWLPMISGKQALYNGIAQYHQSRVCNTSKVNSITVQCTLHNVQSYFTDLKNMYQTHLSQIE